MSDELRDRTKHADDRLEKVAWRVFRRRSDGEPGIARPA
jgi:hypothetical protein